MLAIVKWTARIWAGLSLLFLSAFILGNAEQPGNWPTVEEWIGLACFPTGIIVGLLVAFRWELQGGGIAIMSLVAFYLWHFVVAGSFAAGPWFALVAAPGLLFLITGIFSRSHSSTDKTKPARLSPDVGVAT